MSTLRLHVQSQPYGGSHERLTYRSFSPGCLSSDPGIDVPVRAYSGGSSLPDLAARPGAHTALWTGCFDRCHERFSDCFRYGKAHQTGVGIHLRADRPYPGFRIPIGHRHRNLPTGGTTAGHRDHFPGFVRGFLSQR